MPPQQTKNIYKDVQRECLIPLLWNLPFHNIPKNVEIKVYKATVSPGVLYRHETWSLILWEEQRLRTFEKKGQGGYLYIRERK
jgi:hypothetical protein